MKECSKSCFIDYIKELESKNCEYLHIIHQLQNEIESKCTNYVNLENDFIDLKKVSHVKTLDKQLCDALRDMDILKKKLEKYEKTQKKNTSTIITSHNEDIHSDVNDDIQIDNKRSKKSSTKNPKVANTIKKKDEHREKIDDLIYEDINEYVNEYINNNIIVKESDLDDILLFNNDIIIKNEIEIEKTNTESVNRDDKHTKNEVIIEISDDEEEKKKENTIDISDIINENDDKKSEPEQNEESSDEMELIEKKIGKITYYMSTDGKDEIYEILDDGDVGKLLGHLVITKNGDKGAKAKTKEKLEYLSSC